MIAIQLGRAKPLSCNPGSIGGLAYHGCGYALPSPHQNSIAMLDTQLSPLLTVETRLPYSHLCFDAASGVYWAAVDGSAELLFRLGNDFQELGRQKLEGFQGKKLLGMSCACGGLWLAFAESVVFFSPCDGRCQRFQTYGRNRVNTGILGLDGGRMLSYLEQGRQIIEILCADGNERLEFCLSKDYTLEAMVLRGVCQTEEGSTMYDVRLLVSKPCNREKLAIDCGICGCAEGCTPKHCCPKPPCGCDCGCCPPQPCCDSSAKWEVLHSVALEEAGLAHILNAEGEKLQKAVATCDKIEDLLCVNESVRRVIMQVTQLEAQLYAKLQILTECCPDLCPPPCPDDCCPPCP